MKLLFIGGTGNISTDCASLLCSQGHDIAVVTRGKSEVPPAYRRIVADRKDPVAFENALKGYRPDVVLNFIGYEVSDLEVDYRIFAGKVQQYLFISSATVYAKPPAKLPITENAPLGNPFWEYAARKLECEQWLMERYRTQKFPVTIVRPSHTYSPRWIPNPVSSSSYTFAARFENGLPVYIPDDGQTLWTLTATSDFAEGLAGLLGTSSIGEAFHITSDEALTWNQIYAEIADALQVPLPEVVGIPTEFICSIAPQMTGTLKGDKAHPAVFDNSKLRRFVPGFRCKKSFRDGVRESVKWLREHPEVQNRRPELDELIEKVLRAWKTREQTVS